MVKEYQNRYPVDHQARDPAESDPARACRALPHLVVAFLLVRVAPAFLYWCARVWISPDAGDRARLLGGVGMCQQRAGRRTWLLGILITVTGALLYSAVQRKAAQRPILTAPIVSDDSIDEATVEALERRVFRLSTIAQKVVSDASELTPDVHQEFWGIVDEPPRLPEDIVAELKKELLDMFSSERFLREVQKIEGNRELQPAEEQAFLQAAAAMRQSIQALFDRAPLPNGASEPRADAHPAASAIDADAFPLHIAAARGDTAEIETLLAAGADPNAITLGMSPVICASITDRVAAIRLLAGRGADVNAANAAGHTALILASARGNVLAVKALLSCGADPNQADSVGWSPLHHAILPSSCSTGVVRELTASGADVNLQDANHGRTPLHRAAQFGHCEAVKILLSSGARVDIRDNMGMTPAGRAAGSPEILELLSGTREGGIPEDISTTD